MKPRVNIFVHHPYCSVQSGSGIYEALHRDFRTGFFTVEEIKPKLFRTSDIIVFPGGLGDSDTYDKILKPFEDSIRNYVSKGGHYLGICMGAYWAGSHYFDLLESIQPVQYIKRPRADVKRSFGTTAEIIWNKEKHNMFFYDGCSLIGKETECQVVARYKNKDPMAIIQNNVGVIGCHPESMKSWYSKKFMKPKWHKYNHHRLLSDFAKTLLGM